MSTVVAVSPRPRIIEPDAIEPGFREQRVIVVLVVVLLCIRREGSPT
jgi:hypothetical protein